MREGLRRIAKAHGEEVAIAGVLLSPVDLPLLIMGIDGWIQTVLFDSVNMKRMLEITVPFFLQYADALAADGAELIALPLAFLSPALVTSEIVEKITLPVLRDVLAEVRVPVVIHHAGSPFLKFLHFCAELTNVAGYVLDYTDDLALARKTLGAGVTLLGGLDGPNLDNTKAAAIEAECERVLVDRRNDPNFVLCASGPDVALNTPRENIHAMRTAVESFGAVGSG